MKLVLAITLVTVLEVASIPLGNQRPIRYDNFSVYKVQLQNAEQRHIINSLLNDSEGYNLWHNGRRELHIMVNPKQLKSFLRIMAEEKFLVELLIPNVQALIDAERTP